MVHGRSSPQTDPFGFMSCGGMSCNQWAKLSILMAGCTRGRSDSSQRLWRRCPGGGGVEQQGDRVGTQRRDMMCGEHFLRVFVVDEQNAHTTQRRLTQNTTQTDKIERHVSCGEVFCVQNPPHFPSPSSTSKPFARLQDRSIQEQTSPQLPTTHEDFHPLPIQPTL